MGSLCVFCLHGFFKPFHNMTQAVFASELEAHVLRLFPTCRPLLPFPCMTQALVGERFF